MRAGELTPVKVPEADDEALRDLTRAEPSSAPPPCCCAQVALQQSLILRPGN